MFQVAVAEAPGLEVHENFVLTLDGTVISAREVIGVTGSRFHVVEPQPGKLLLSYTATVTGRADPPEVLEHELIEYLRPSRYAESDKLAVIAAQEFGGITAPDDLLAGVAAWVGGHLSYVSAGSTRCSDRCTAGRIRRCWRCSSGSAATATTWLRSSHG